MNRIVSKTPRQGVVVALLVHRVLGRTSTAVGNWPRCFFINIFQANQGKSDANRVHHPE